MVFLALPRVDRERSDWSEGDAGWIVPTLKSVPVTAGSEYLNPVSVLCMSRPEVDLAHLKQKGPTSSAS